MENMYNYMNDITRVNEVLTNISTACIENNTNIDDYISLAVRTESQIDAICTDKESLRNLMLILITAGNMLDMIKKQVFYGKSIDNETWTQYQQTLTNVVAQIPQTVNEFTHIKTDPRIFHAILGITTESAELLSALNEDISHRKPMDHVNIREEFFDAMWYILIGHDALEQSFAKTMEMGFNKLMSRYPDKFDAHKAVHRNIEAERLVLEKYQE